MPLFGRLGRDRATVEEGMAKIAGWYDWRELDISGEAGDVNINTKYSGLILNGILNPTSSPVTAKLKTANNPTATLTIIIGANGSLWPLPEIQTIVQSGTSDNLILCFQKK